MNSEPILTNEEIQICLDKRGHSNQLGYAVLMAYHKRFIRFPSKDDKPVPFVLLAEVSSLIGIGSLG